MTFHKLPFAGVDVDSLFVITSYQNYPKIDRLLIVISLHCDVFHTGKAFFVFLRMNLYNCSNIFESLRIRSKI